MFDKVRLMIFPRSVLIGHGVLERLPDMLDSLSLNGKPLIVTGEKTWEVAGKKVSEMLAERDPDVIKVGDCTIGELDAVSKRANNPDIELIMGVGGGGKIDLAKLVGAKVKLPMISIPTSASHDGIVSSRASIKDGASSISQEAIAPMGIVADTSIIAKAPPRLMASGCADVVGNLVAVADWRLALSLKNAPFSSSAAALSEMAARLILDNISEIEKMDENAAWIVLKGLIASGVSMCIAGSSRPASGSEHKFSHALELVAPGKAMHGEACGIGAIMMAYAHQLDWKMIRDALARIGAPTKARKLGIENGEVIEALVRAPEIRPERFTIVDNGITREAAERLARVTGVIG
jgi:glycerol-1-phosphate dehydrogenase [NAD(P)+]